MTIRVCVIDDDQEILDFFKHVSNEISQAKFDLITNEISELISHLESTSETDLVIIDVNMPQFNGFDVAEYIKMHYASTSIIFMSYFPEYALGGYKYYPADFLVKPINILRLKSTLNLINNHKSKRKKKIGINSNGKIHLVDVDNILYIEKVGRKTCINLENKKIIECNQGLTVIEEMLKESNFFRSHQSFLVPLDKIEEVIQDTYMKSYNLKIKNCQRAINVSRNKYRELKELLTFVL
ncbi:LytR/AlgR family response regulator transcription factor [Bacillus halotolerans]|uniref:LytR/AlgR family response regulator transcription factor n=1 Tax=Bacillus halotolerans TaxID=260554 RepID=UPI002DB7C494|nr:LytTR family DNA-binding domain-containing protein [Bacillus halotolerans]MEC1543688.1 LytTR family DNA-binding domain-containing protein [Bacillus halotolerans]